MKNWAWTLRALRWGCEIIFQLETIYFGVQRSIVLVQFVYFVYQKLVCSDQQKLGQIQGASLVHHDYNSNAPLGGAYKL